MCFKSGLGHNTSLPHLYGLPFGNLSRYYSYRKRETLPALVPDTLLFGNLPREKRETVECGLQPSYAAASRVVQCLIWPSSLIAAKGRLVYIIISVPYVASLLDTWDINSILSLGVRSSFTCVLDQYVCPHQFGKFRQNYLPAAQIPQRVLFPAIPPRLHRKLRECCRLVAQNDVSTALISVHYPFSHSSIKLFTGSNSVVVSKGGVIHKSKVRS